jgi:hypothetical protein
MRRIQLTLAALAMVVTALTAFSGPVVAQDLNCRDARGYLIRCDGELYAPYDHGSYYHDDGYYDNGYYDNGYYDDGYYDDDYYYDDEDCWEWSGVFEEWQYECD